MNAQDLKNLAINSVDQAKVDSTVSQLIEKCQVAASHGQLDQEMSLLKNPNEVRRTWYESGYSFNPNHYNYKDAFYQAVFAEIKNKGFRITEHYGCNGLYFKMNWG